MKAFADGPLVGTPEQIIEALVDLQSRGMTYAITYFVEQAYDLSGVEMFEQSVIPRSSSASSTATCGTSCTGAEVPVAGEPRPRGGRPSYQSVT